MTATTATGELPIVTTPPLPAGPVPDAAPSLVDRLRSITARRLTAPGGVVLAMLVLAPGVLMDLAFGGTFGLASSVTFFAAAVVAALVVRRRALATAMVLPPLLFLGAVAVLARFSGNNQGSREVALDVGTTLAISAPVLFAGTVATAAVVLGRLLVGLARR